MILSYEVVKDNGVIHHYITLRIKPCICPNCSSSELHIKEYRTRIIKHAALRNITEIIHYKARRFVCRNCETTFYEYNPFSVSAHRISTQIKIDVLEVLRNPRVTYCDVASNFHISNTEVIKIFDSFVNIDRISLPRILCIDEIHIPMIAYSSAYVCVMMDFQSSNLIEVLPTRFKVDLLRYFDAIPMEERNNVKYVCIDMWEPYKDVINRRLRSALVLIDSFHVVEHLTKDFTSLRIRIMNQYETNSNEYYLLKKWNWLLIKKSIELDNQAKFNHRLKRYVNLRNLLNLQLEISQELHKAYDLMNRYLSFNDLATENNCRIQLNEIIHDFILADIPEYSEFITLLQNWKEEIINSFTRVDGKRISNGPMESLNGRIDKLEANVNGVKNYKRFRNRTIFCFNKTVQYKLTAKYKTNKSEGAKRGHYKK